MDIQSKIEWLKKSVHNLKRPVIIMNVSLYRDIIAFVPRKEVEYIGEQIYLIVHGTAKIRIITTKDIDFGCVMIFDEAKGGSVTFTK